MKRRRYLESAAGTATVLLLAGCTDDEDEDSSGGDANNGGGNGGDASGNGGDDSGSGDSNSGGGSDIELVDHQFYQDDFSVGVRGTAENTSGEELSYVEAEAVFLDENDTQIGEGIDNVTDLAAGRRWEFECMFLGSDEERIDSYEITVSTGF